MGMKLAYLIAGAVLAGTILWLLWLTANSRVVG